MPSVPPFAGFPPAASRFLHDLEAHNDRDWFQAHKQAYLDSIVAPAQSFVVALGERLQEILHTPAFVDRCFELCRELAPLHRWLVTVDRRTHARR